MIKTFSRCVVIAGLALATVPLAGSPTTANEEVFELLAGNWRGKGVIKTSPESKKESIRCRLRANNNAADRKLNMSGNCGVAGFVFSLGGWIKQNGTKNSYNASMFRTIAALKTNVFSGKRRGKNLDFTFDGLDRTSNEKIAAKIQVVTKGKNGFDVKVSRTDPKTKKSFFVGTIKFSRK